MVFVSCQVVVIIENTLYKRGSNVEVRLFSANQSWVQRVGHYLGEVYGVTALVKLEIRHALKQGNYYISNMTSYESINGSLALLPHLKEDESSLISLDSSRHPLRKYLVHQSGSKHGRPGSCELQCCVTVKGGHYF